MRAFSQIQNGHHFCTSRLLSFCPSTDPNHRSNVPCRPTFALTFASAAAPAATLSSSAVSAEINKPLVVVGSANADIYVEIDRLPKQGETVGARDGQTLAGGKGANQACCSGRLAHPTYFVGQIGDDAHGRLIEDALRLGGVRLDRLARVVAAPTGFAVVMLEPDGQNSIIIIGGANMRGWPEKVRREDLEIVATAGVVLLQREIPDRINIQVAEAAKNTGVPVILDAGGVDANPNPISSSSSSNLSISIPISDPSKPLSMASRTLELTLISAKDLRDVNVFSKMDVYAVATIAGDHRTQQRTPIDRDGGKNPSWNSTLRFSVPADPVSANRLVIHVLLRAQRTLGDRDVGEVHIPIKELLDGLNDGSKFVSYQVRKPGSGKAKGVLNLSYKFLDSPAIPAAKPAEPVTVYPAPASQKPPKENEPVMAYPAAGGSGSAYPPSYPPAGGYPSYQPQGNYAAYPQPPQGGYGYGAPSQAGYGYGAPPPAGYGYGAPPAAAGYGYGAVPPRKNKNNLGLGLGAGLLGGALGGMLIGDMISDDAAYDAGYDAGFDDGGFGF